jgi:hypothetical protein
MKTTLFLLAAATATALAGPPAAEPARLDAPAAPSAWDFRLSPYGWLTGLDGTMTLGPESIAVDSSFSDIFEVLDMAAALEFEARTGAWGFLVDGFYAKLSASGSGPLGQPAEVEFQQFIGDFNLLYRVEDSAAGFLDLYAGARLNSLSVDLTRYPLFGPAVTRAADVDWLDPLVGLRGQLNLSPRWFLAGKGDIGGFDVSSQLTWMVQATVGYQFSETFSTELGYRYLDTDYQADTFGQDIAQGGLLVAFNWRF